MPERSSQGRVCADSSRRGRAFMPMLLGVAAGLCGGATLGALARGAPAAHPPPPASALVPEESLESLRSALARAVLSHALTAPVTSEEAPGPSSDLASSAHDAEIDEAEPPEDDGEGAKEARSLADPAAVDPTERGWCACPVRIQHWRNPWHGYYWPYWRRGPWYQRSSGWEQGADERAESWSGWLPPPPPPERPEQPRAMARPRMPQRVVLRLQGRSPSGASGAGLVCLASPAAGSAGTGQLSLLRSVVRGVAGASVVPERTALLVHGTALGILVPPSPEEGAGPLAANLAALGVSDQDQRAAAVMRAFQRLAAPLRARRAQAIDDRSRSR